MRLESSSLSSQFFFPRFLRRGSEPLRGVDQLHLAARWSGLRLVEHPDIGGDAGVVEDVERQGDDGLQPVVLDDPAADIAFALSGVPVNSDEPLWTSAMRLPSGVSCFILESMLARNIIWPSLERVTREYSASPPCSMMKRGSYVFLAAHRSRSVFQLLP